MMGGCGSSVTGVCGGFKSWATACCRGRHSCVKS